VCFNILLVSPAAALVDFITDQTVFNFEFSAFPRGLEVYWQFAVFLVIEDAAFYWSHRLLHIPILYRNIHKTHHEYKTTISTAAEYSHPLEYLFGNILPVVLGPKLLGYRCHIWTFWMWLIVRLNRTIEFHSGYSFPWSPWRIMPWFVGGDFHDFHQSRVTGNYGGVFGWWDAVLKTKSKGYEKRSTGKEIEKVN
jgi:sterol desaturase/sphingolipid hydroxylase (fatty acid hydroxylase superfamily)